MLHTIVERRVLKFKQPATTSRGSYTTRTIRLVRINDDRMPGVEGVGECSPLPDLSVDALDDDQYDMLLLAVLDDLRQTGVIDYEALRPYPSILFGIESAMWQLSRGGSAALSDTPFARGEEGIRINGLVWMGSFDEMMRRMDDKVAQGFKCIKIKIGGIDFDHELQMIEALRDKYDKNIELRLDANGSFSPDNALERLKRLAPFAIHSIEQPIRQRQWDAMSIICQESPIPIALDEELIGVSSPDDKRRLLDTIRPKYLVIKPTLHGGITGTKEWVELARERGVKSWITSALESNVGLNAIAHLAASIYDAPDMMPQGLGTGQLFVENLPMPLDIRGERLYFSPEK